MLFLLTAYLYIAVPLLLALLSWRVTGKATFVFDQKTKLVLMAVALAAVGLPLFLAGSACALFWGGSAAQTYFTHASTGGYGYSFHMMGLMISVPSAIVGFFICRVIWRRMRRNLKP